MAGFNRVNGSDHYVAGTVYATQQHKAFKIAVKTLSDAVDLRVLSGGVIAEAGDAAYVECALEKIIRELNPAMYFAPADASGVVCVVMDGHAVNAESLQTRIRNVLKGQGGNADYGQTTLVSQATSLTAA